MREHFVRPCSSHAASPRHIPSRHSLLFILPLIHTHSFSHSLTHSLSLAHSRTPISLFLSCTPFLHSSLPPLPDSLLYRSSLCFLSLYSPSFLSLPPNLGQFASKSFSLRLKAPLVDGSDLGLINRRRREKERERGKETKKKERKTKGKKRKEEGK